ncbi:MAG: ArnT family glycosyltransferase [Gemmataceae bacterium]
MRLDDRDLWPSHEARAAQDAQNVLETGHWGVLHLFDGTPEYQKPPLFYWLVAGVGWLRGSVVDAWSVRLPAAIAGWLTVAIIVGWLRRRGRPIAACAAGCAMLCANHFLATSRTGRIDAPLMCCVTAAILSSIQSRWVAASICIAAALMLKGPIGLILFLPVVCATGINPAAHSEKTSPIGKRAAGFIPAVLGVCLAAPWFIAVSIETHGEFARAFFWHHNFERAAGNSADLASHPWWFYFARWAVDWLPATPALLVAGWVSLKRFWWRDDFELRLGGIWVCTMTALLSLSHFKRADYLLPAYPGAAILVGCALERLWLTRNDKKWIVTCAAGILGTSLVGAVVFESLILPRIDEQFEKRTLADKIRHHRQPEAAVIFFRIEDHLLAYHLGKPLQTIQEWENLDIWVSQLENGCIIMPAELAAEWPQHIHSGTLREIIRHDEPHRSRSLVVMESHPAARP